MTEPAQNDIPEDQIPNKSGFRSDKVDLPEPEDLMAPGEKSPLDTVGDPTPEPEPEPEPDSQSGGQPQVSLTPESLAALEKVAASAKPAPEPEPQPTLTEEDLAQITKQYVVSVDDAAFFLNKDVEDITEDDVKRMQMHTDRIRDNATAVSELTTKLQMREVQKMIEPLLVQHAQATKQSVKERFYGQYPGLANCEPLVQQAAQSAMVGFEGTEEEGFKLVAEQVVSMAKSMNVDIDPAKPISKATNQEPQKPAVPTMAKMAQGGRSPNSGEQAGGEGHQFKNPWTGKPYNPNPNIK